MPICRSYFVLPTYLDDTRSSNPSDFIQNEVWKLVNDAEIKLKK